MSQPPSYSGRRTPNQPTPPKQPRASDGDAWLVMMACLPYAVPVETIARKPDPRPLPFGMFKRVARAEVLDARRAIRERRNA